MTRVKSDLWSHLTLLIDPYYLGFRGLVFSILLNKPLRSQICHLFFMVYEPGQEILHVTHLRSSLVRTHSSTNVSLPLQSVSQPQHSSLRGGQSRNQVEGLLGCYHCQASELRGRGAPDLPLSNHLGSFMICP